MLRSNSLAADWVNPLYVTNVPLLRPVIKGRIHLPLDFLLRHHLPYKQKQWGLEASEHVKYHQSNVSTASLATRNIDYRLVVTLPDDFASFPGLTRLSIIGNHCSFLPRSFSTLTALTSLTLSSNMFFDFPPILQTLPQLLSLDLSSNFIDRIPSWTSSLTSLPIFNSKRTTSHDCLPA